jgi:hypothetical protein
MLGNVTSMTSGSVDALLDELPLDLGFLGCASVM